MRIIDGLSSAGQRPNCQSLTSKYERSTFSASPTPKAAIIPECVTCLSTGTEETAAVDQHYTNLETTNNPWKLLKEPQMDTHKQEIS